MFDTLIRGGKVIDGTGRTWFRADVGVTGDTVNILHGDTSALEAGRVIDATGLAVCPGFIDMHSHSDFMLLTNPRHEVKIGQGVTTECLGQDGLSYAPVSDVNRQHLVDYLAAVNGRPPEDVAWTSVKSFLDLFDRGAACNVVYFVPHAAVRLEVMGWEDRLPTPEELKRMQGLVGEGMRDGAFGFSTGLTYVPNVYSDTEELVALARATQPYGGMYVTHARYGLGDRLLDPFREAVEVGRQAGVPVQISHYHSPVDGMGDQMVSLVDEGRDADVDVTYDQYPYPAASTILLSLIPPWVHEGGPSQLLERIRDPEVRERIKDEVYPQWGGGLDQYFFAQIGSDRNKEWEGRSLVDYAEAKSKRVVDAICDLLIEERLDVAFVARTGNPENIRTILKHPAQMVGSDGLMTGDHPNPRTYGTFPYVLGQAVRDEGLVRLEDAVAKMTAIPAQRLGLSDRGILRDGMKADVVVFDPANVRATATFDDPKQMPVGIEYVFVNGKQVWEHGRHTGALPGRALRRV
ncbi:MAG: D-aminoacylase [Dehalococcoidia bacterium]